MKLAIAVLGIVLATGSGCGRSKDKLEKQKAEARKAGEKAAADVLKAYVDSMVSTMGKYALAESEGEFAPMEEWRKRAAATRIQELAEEKASKFGDSPLRRSLRQGTAVFTVIRDYHIGRPIAGEETIVKAGEPKDEKWSGEGRIVLEKDDYFEQLEAFRGSEAAKPWIPALDFERLLPWVMELYAFRGKGGVDTRRYLMHLDNASRFVRGLWSGSDGQYVAYRDKLCKDGVKAACRIPYEHRHLVVAGQYVDFARDKIGEFRKTHPNSDFEPLLARFESDLDLEKKNIAVPEEYPPLPLSLLGWVPSPRPRATLTMGRKGASFVMRTDEGADTRPLTDARKGWALSAAERTALEARFRDAGERLYASTEAHHGGPRIQVLAEGSVTADVLVGSLTRAALKAKVNSLVLVGRDDKLLQRRGFAVTEAASRLRGNRPVGRRPNGAEARGSGRHLDLHPELVDGVRGRRGGGRLLRRGRHPDAPNGPGAGGGAVTDRGGRGG